MEGGSSTSLPWTEKPDGGPAAACASGDTRTPSGSDSGSAPGAGRLATTAANIHLTFLPGAGPLPTGRVWFLSSPHVHLHKVFYCRRYLPTMQICNSFPTTRPTKCPQTLHLSFSQTHSCPFPWFYPFPVHPSPPVYFVKPVSPFWCFRFLSMPANFGISTPPKRIASAPPTIILCLPF